MLVTTREAARITGLSAYELRVGFKQGRYPALEIGRGDRRKTLKWDIDVLNRYLADQMKRDHVTAC